MEDKIERLLFSPNQNNAELALILADNEGIKIEQLPAVKWIINHVFKLKELPEGFEIDTEVISRIMSKRTIEISGKLGLLPNNLYLLSHLIKLSLDFKNHYGYLSDSISNLGNLNILQIKNYASNLPSNLKALKKLKSLEITNCTSFNENDSIWKMYWLERLEIERCNLNEVPLSIEKFENLDYFSIQENPIKKLPDALMKLKKLKFISCYLCQNLEIPPNQMKAFNACGIVILQ